MAQLKLVKGKTYASTVLLGKGVILNRGDIVSVDDEKKVEALLADTFFDRSNNEHSYFEVVGEDEVAAVAARKEETAKARRARRPKAEEEV